MCSPRRGARRFTRYDGMIGLEYAGITDTTLSLEAANRHLAGFDKALEASPDGQAENINQYVFTYRGTYLREKLEDDPANPQMILSEWGVGYRFQPPPPASIS